MTAAEFKKKWHRYTGKESVAYQEHFNDLCRLLGHPTPVEADPSGNDFFCFQKGVVKDVELLGLDAADADARPKKGFADVWYKDHFGWEYKGKHKDLDEAYRQLQQYRESLLNPPLMVVCDFNRFIIRTNFNGTVREDHEFTNDQIDRPEILALLRHVFFDPGYLKPQRTTNEVTEKVAGQMAKVALSLQKRESVELADARTRAEVTVAQKKNLRIARFLNRIVFCFFAEDTLLLPKDLFTDIIKSSLHDPRHFAETTESLFRVMAKGGSFGKDKIRHFNGHLFEDASVFELTEDEIKQLAEAAEADWQFIQPSIMGTLFQRALDESHRAQLGAHYTGEDEIKTIVEPVLMVPLRREWAALKATLRASLGGASVPASRASKARQEPRPTRDQARAHLQKFLKKLRSIIVLDPACGSGNFLYISLQLLLALEKEVITFAAQLGFSFSPEVSVQQLKAIEINSYAFELAQVSVQIGWLQWRRDNGFDNDRSPVLQNLDGFENKDALLNQTFRKKPKSLKEAQAEEHADDDTVKVYTERAWPECDVLVGNPPFLGDKVMRRELGDDYVEELRKTYGGRIPGQSDLCCYWFEKARDAIEHKRCERAGLLATQGIRHGANREVLRRIKETGDIFFAISDREWILSGANVNVSMVAFDNGSESSRNLDGKPVETIHANLTGAKAKALDLTGATPLVMNEGLCFVGVMKGGPFDLPDSDGRNLLALPNPHGKPNSDVLRPRVTAFDILRRGEPGWIIDYGVNWKPEDCAGYEAPWKHATSVIKPARDDNRRKRMAEKWWIHGEARPGMRRKLEGLSRILVTPEVSKHRIFVWLPPVFLPDHKLRAIATDSDYWFGVLHSHFHELWALRLGSRLQTRPCYTPTTCFETFPFPFPDDLQPTAQSSAEAESLELNGGMASMVERRFLKVKEEPPSYHVSGSSGRESAHSSPPAGDQSRLTSAATKEEHRAAIAAAVQELNKLRERWLNPPEWTVEKILEFPGSADGPWARYIDPNTVREVGRVTPCAPSSESNERRAEDCPPYLVGTVRYPRLEPRDADCAAKLKKRTLTNLYNERPAWLDLAHKKLDAAVAAAYSWPADLSDEQILEKLLALNLARAAEEAKAATVKKPKAQRTKHAEEMI